MTTPPLLESVVTSALRVGDIVHLDGMRLIIDQPLNGHDDQSRRNPNSRFDTTYWTAARIDNWAELKQRATAEIADHIANGAATFITRRAEDQRWTIQGNDLATWNREITPPPTESAVGLGE